MHDLKRLALTTLRGFWWRLGRGPAYGQGAAAGLAPAITAKRDAA